MNTPSAINTTLVNSELLNKLDEFIRKYYKNKLLQGALLFVGSSLSFFLLVSTLEYFGRFNTSIRTFLFYSFIVFIAAILYRLILVPVFKLYKIGQRLDYDSASDIIGNHFGAIKDKLLNTLQLSRQLQNEFDNQFLLASIHQKTTELRPIKFSSAIDLKKNKRFLKYVIGPVGLLIAIMFIAPGFKESTTRLISHSQHFATPPPFDFILNTKVLETLQNEDFELELGIKGNIVPDEVYLVTDGNRFKMKKDGQSTFKFTLKNVQKSFAFHFESGQYSSNEYTLVVKQKPILLDFGIQLDYPTYTGRPDERLENIGDLTVPAGTKILWKFNTKYVKTIQLRFLNTVVKATEEDENRFSYSKLFKTSERINISTSNADGQSSDSIVYLINVLPDAYPQINFKERHDSSNSKLIYFVGDINDDYGFKKLVFHSKYVESNNIGKTQTPSQPIIIGINTLQNSQNFYYLWDLNTLNIEPGEKIEYYFEIWDNDMVNGSKATRTSNGLFAAPTLEQIEKQSEASNQAIKDEMEQAIKNSKAMEEDIKKLQQKLTEKKTLNWEDKKHVQNLLQKHQELQEKMKALNAKNKEKSRKEAEFKSQDKDLLDKQQELEKLFEELMDEETKKLLEKMKELLQNNQKDELQEQMDKFKFNDKELKKKMERALELFKQLELEKKLKETTDKLDQLAKEQEKLAEETKKEKDQTGECEKKQEDLNKKFDDLKKDLKDIKDKNDALEKPNDLKDTKAKEESIEQKQKESLDQLQKKQNKKAAPFQKKAAEEMKEMSEKMKEEMTEMSSENQEEDYNTLRQILENLVTVSKDQEKLMKDFRAVGGYNPKFVELAQNQKKLRDDTKIIEDSLFALSKRVIQIQSFINKEIGLVNHNMDKALANLGYRNIPNLVNNEQYIMTSLNNLALMLSEVLKQMQEQMKNAKPNPNCKNPKPGKGKKPGMKEMKEMQDRMNKEMGEMMKNGSGKKPSSKQLAQMAAQQSALRKKLRDLEKELDKEGKSNKLGDLDKTQELMDEVEKDLVNKKINEETLRRQREILTRLLDHERAEKEQEQDEERKSNEGQEIKRDLPPSLQDYLKQQQKGQDLLRTVSPNLNPYYKEKVKSYLKSLELHE